MTIVEGLNEVFNPFIFLCQKERFMDMFNVNNNFVKNEYPFY